MLVDYLIYKRTLATTGYACNAGEYSERYFYRNVLQIIFTAACYLQPFLSGLSAFFGYFYL